MSYRCTGCNSKLTEKEHTKMLKNMTLLEGGKILINKLFTGEYFPNNSKFRPYKTKRFGQCSLCGKYKF